jgi:hypothetical protein
MPSRTVFDQVVVCREAIVIEVGGIPRQYGRVTVTDRKTEQKVEIDDTDNPPLVEEQPGRIYAFREGQRVRRDHEAVEANPSAFRDVGATDTLVYGMPEE